MTSNDSQPETGSIAYTWRSTQAYAMAVVCLGAGMAVGYFARGTQAAAPVKQAMTSDPHASAPEHLPMPTLDQMKQMGDTAAAPHIEKIKSNPQNFEALNNAGKVYRATHQFKEAAGYYQKALEIDPKNAAVRTDLASCLYYTGDVDGALAQLDKALSYDPTFYGALLNAGIIKLQAKHDVNGAIGSWEKIVRADGDPRHKQTAQKLIASAKQKSAKVITSETPKT
jgi:tetratricopeptide (TPR) repeat protein